MKVIDSISSKNGWCCACGERLKRHDLGKTEICGETVCGDCSEKYDLDDPHKEAEFIEEFIWE